MDRYATLRDGLANAWCPSLRATGLTLYDLVGLNNGTLTNMAGQYNWRGSEGGVCLNLDGNNDVVVCASQSFVNTNRLTVSAWVNPGKATRGDWVTCWDDGTRPSQFNLLQGVTNNKFRFFISDGAARGTPDSVTSFVVGRWYHICGTYDGATIALYVNGALEASAARTTTFTTLSLPAIRFGNNANNDGIAQGGIDDIRIYRRALTYAEIRLLALQRGIGLVPTRHRRGSALSQFWTRISGEWKRATPWINVGGTWKKATPKLRTGGAWKG